MDGVEVLPAIDAAVGIRVGLAAQRPVAVEIGPLIGAAITILVGTQLDEPAGEIVVTRLGPLRGGGRHTSRGRRGKGRDQAKCR